MNIQVNKLLLQKIASGEASKEEIQFFDEWLTKLDTEEYQNFLDEYQIIFSMYSSNEVPDENLWNKIGEKIDRFETSIPSLKRKQSTYWKLVAAASILIFAIGAYFLSAFPDKIDHSQAVVQEQITNDIVPGTNKAILKLEDGSSIILDDSSEERIVLQSGLLMTKTKDGHLVYEVKDSGISEDAITFNTIETPRGGEYQVILPDGTKVWLNASSSLRFPTAFKGKERRVELSGEGYFEVAKDKNKPFIVSTTKEVVEVLGTHFNINSYEDEGYSRTTLIEGKVKVFVTGENDNDIKSFRLLKPGQQSVIHGDQMKVIAVDVQESLAWKNGEFMFNKEEIESVMRKIARWYDVEVVYPADFKKMSIWGSVSRFENISEVLRVIELTGSVHFKIEGRRVYMMN